MDLKNELVRNIDKIHTTDMGVLRIKNNLNLKTDDVVGYCIDLINEDNSDVIKKGKNYYVKLGDVELTVNGSSFTVITAHKI